MQVAGAAGGQQQHTPAGWPPGGQGTCPAPDRCPRPPGGKASRHTHQGRASPGSARPSALAPWRQAAASRHARSWSAGVGWAPAGLVTRWPPLTAWPAPTATFPHTRPTGGTAGWGTPAAYGTAPRWRKRSTWTSVGTGWRSPTTVPAWSLLQYHCPQRPGARCHRPAQPPSWRPAS